MFVGKEGTEAPMPKRYSCLYADREATWTCGSSATKPKTQGKRKSDPSQLRKRIPNYQRPTTGRKKRVNQDGEKSEFPQAERSARTACYRGGIGYEGVGSEIIEFAHMKALQPGNAKTTRGLSEQAESCLR